MGNKEIPDQNKLRGKVFTMPDRGRQSYNPKEIYYRIEKVNALFEEALKLENSNIHGALKLYQKVVELDETRDAAFVNIGRIYRESFNLEKAEENWQIALAINPRNTTANYNMGELRDKQGKNDEAVEYYLKAIEIYPGYADAHCNLAITYQSLGEYKKAIKHYEIYLNLKTNDHSQDDWKQLAKSKIEECRKLLEEWKEE